jgi:hypothetical protein
MRETTRSMNVHTFEGYYIEDGDFFYRRLFAGALHR